MTKSSEPQLICQVTVATAILHTREAAIAAATLTEVAETIDEMTEEEVTTGTLAERATDHETPAGTLEETLGATPTVLQERTAIRWDTLVDPL